MKYGVSGMLSNTALYCGYLMLTLLGMGPKTAMTLMYGSGVLLSFVLNRRWTFSFAGHPGQALTRHVSAYLLFYLLNLIGLWALVDVLGWPHEAVQAFLILVCAAGLFLTLKFWVFPAQFRTGD